ncbi:hypothetical protein M405DRAFT_808498 [Rhizopogon salebrosus TDB-379]|nr:hypothetical protein M405DRAFT_808498 [Rhizopogon salebrosus TDB-379]
MFARFRYNMLINENISKYLRNTMLGSTSSTLRSLLHHFESAWLFTSSDFKTIIAPVMVFAVVSSPRHTSLGLPCSLCWLWFHLLQINLANQAYSVEEDNLNKPWRPVPSGRISIMACHAWRWRVVVFCLCLSFLFSFKVLVTSATFAVLVILHDDFGLSGHPILKILCNVGGYASFELGSTLILSGGSSLDTTCITALSCSALVVLMTILAQDFADVNGDRKLGRRTLPMVAPKGSRIYMLAVFPVLSLGLGSIWSLGPLCTLFFVSIGFGVGLRYFLLRSEVCDQSSFILYNMWLLGVHLLPANARFHVLTW